MEENNFFEQNIKVDFSEGIHITLWICVYSHFRKNINYHINMNWALTYQTNALSNLVSDFFLVYVVCVDLTGKMLWKENNFIKLYM